MNSEAFRNIANYSLKNGRNTIIQHCWGRKKEKQSCIYINYIYKFWGIFSESKSTTTNLEGLRDEYNVKHYVQVFSESRPRTTPSPVRGIEMFDITGECPFAPQNNTFEEKQFIFCRIKESLMPSWNALLWKRPKSSSNCSGLERPSPPGQNLHSSWAIYETKQLPPTTLRMLKLPISVPLPRCKHTQIPWQTSHMHCFSGRAQDWGGAQIILLVTTSQRSWSAIKFFSMGLRFCPPQQCQIQIGIRNGK